MNGRIGPFILQAELGRGAMGVVYKALDTRIDRVVALKQVPVENEEDLLLFRREAKTAASLDHPGICSVHEFADDELGAPYLVMDHIVGVCLHERLQVGIRPDRCVDLAIDLAEAVAHAHSRGVIHRDLKPANIMVDTQMKPVILDFGLARRLAESIDLTETGQLVGTPAYLAPEQATQAHKVGPAADVYGLGAILYECLTRRAPFVGDSSIEIADKALNEPPPPPSRFVPELDPAVEQVVLRCLEKDPRKRYPTAYDLIGALKATRGEVVDTPASGGGRERLLIVITCVALLVCALLTAMLIGKR